jgi:hypothetical protein
MMSGDQNKEVLRKLSAHDVDDFFYQRIWPQQGLSKQTAVVASMTVLQLSKLLSTAPALLAVQSGPEKKAGKAHPRLHNA